MKRLTIPAVFLAFCAWRSFAAAQSYDPPATYYNSATGTGATLKQQLNDIIDGHTDIGYDAARSALQVTDADPNNPGHMITVYDRTSVNVAAINGSPPGWDNGTTWNREHTWPRSRGVGSSGPDDADLFELRPALTSNNGDRGNLNYGGAFGQQWGVVTDNGASYWYPGDADAGMIARQECYMAVRYDGTEGSTSDLEIGAGNPAATSSVPQLGNLNRLIEWNYLVPPDNFERRRNQIIYDQYQHNRNPFTDRPEYVWSVFVNQNNDSSLTLQGAAPTANAGTTLDVDLGRALVGASVPAAKSVTLDKGGLNGTYYQVTTAGAATSSVTGRYNAFATGTTGSKSISVGLNTTTATAGLKVGMVIIDNLDITPLGWGWSSSITSTSRHWAALARAQTTAMTR
jgi:endonuclease I